MVAQADDNKWHMKKEIQLGHLITTFTVAISCVVYINKIEQRVAVMESQILAQPARQDQRQVRPAD